MTFSNSFSKSILLAFALGAACAQAPGVLTVADPVKLVVKRNENPSYSLKISIKPGYHANSNTPSEAYLIPFKVTWDSGPLEPAEVVYPKAKMEKYDFAESALSVFGGDFEVVTNFKRPANAPLGPSYQTGKLRYQACNDKMCLPPKTVEIKLPVLLQ